MIYPTHLRELIGETLRWMGLWSPEAEALVLGTIYQESRGGYYLRQLRGPALGISQVEPATFRWLVELYGARFPFITDRHPHELIWDLRLAIAMCRLRYLAVPGPIPKTLDGQAAYWKAHYNTHLGAGKPEEYVSAWRNRHGSDLT